MLESETGAVSAIGALRSGGPASLTRCDPTGALMRKDVSATRGLRGVTRLPVSGCIAPST